MEKFASPDYVWLWALALALALFYPVRQLIWVMYVRRAERKEKPDDARRAALKWRATVTSILLCLVFSVLYTMHLFSPRP